MRTIALVTAAALTLAGCADPASRLVVDVTAPTYKADPADFKRDLQHCSDLLGIGDIWDLVTETTVASLGGYAVGSGAGKLAIAGVTSAPPAAGLALVVGTTVFVINANNMRERQADNLALCLNKWNHVVYAR